jgi:hypothetical protein
MEKRRMIRRRAEKRPPAANDRALSVVSASTVINHLHGGLTLARRGTAEPDQLPTVYMLDVKALLRACAGTGLAMVPWRDGEPRAYVFAASSPMRDWVAAQINTGRPLWLPVQSVDAAGPPQDQPHTAELPRQAP